MSLYIHKHLLVKDTLTYGLGVFAIGNIKAGEVIETCHHIPLTQPFNEIDKHLQTYLFSWPKDNPKFTTVVLGYGSIYNHSKEPNITWETDEKTNLFVFKTIRDVQAGDELCSFYGEGYEKHIKTV
jgi:SET domain-containing protein